MVKSAAQGQIVSLRGLLFFCLKWLFWICALIVSISPCKAYFLCLLIYLEAKSVVHFVLGLLLYKFLKFLCLVSPILSPPKCISIMNKIQKRYIINLFVNRITFRSFPCFGLFWLFLQITLCLRKLWPCESGGQVGGGGGGGAGDGGSEVCLLCRGSFSGIASCGMGRWRDGKSRTHRYTD